MKGQRLFITIASSLILLPFADNARLAKFTNFICESTDPTFSEFLKCEVKPVKRDFYVLNIETRLLKTPIDEIWVNVLLKKRGNSVKPFLYNITVEVCEFLRNRRRYPIGNLFYRIFGFERFSNMNHTCPYMGNLVVKNYFIDDQILSLMPLPLGEYGFIVVWSQEKRPVVRNEVYVQIYERSGYRRENKMPKNPKTFH